MHKLKRISRGYNPPQILAWELSKKFDKPFIPNLLIKKKITKNQVGLTKKERTKPRPVFYTTSGRFRSADHFSILCSVFNVSIFLILISTSNLRMEKGGGGGGEEYWGEDTHAKALAVHRHPFVVVVVARRHGKAESSWSRQVVRPIIAVFSSSKLFCVPSCRQETPWA